MALLKMISLAAENISKKWAQPIQNWPLTFSSYLSNLAKGLKANNEQDLKPVEDETSGSVLPSPLTEFKSSPKNFYD